MFEDLIPDKTKKLIEIECATCMHSVYHRSMDRYSCERKPAVHSWKELDTT